MGIASPSSVIYYFQAMGPHFSGRMACGGHSGGDSWPGFSPSFLMSLLRPGRAYSGCPFFQCPAVNNGFGTEPAADGLFHLPSKPEDTVNIVAVLNSQLVNHHDEVFKGDETDVPRILVIVFACSLSRGSHRGNWPAVRPDRPGFPRSGEIPA